MSLWKSTSNPNILANSIIIFGSIPALTAELYKLFEILLSTIIIIGSIGFADDYSKIKSNNSKGISSKIRIIFQIIFSFFITCNIYIKKNLTKFTPNIF